MEKISYEEKLVKETKEIRKNNINKDSEFEVRYAIDDWLKKVVKEVETSFSLFFDLDELYEEYFQKIGITKKEMINKLDWYLLDYTSLLADFEFEDNEIIITFYEACLDLGFTKDEIKDIDDYASYLGYDDEEDIVEYRKKYFEINDFINKNFEHFKEECELGPDTLLMRSILIDKYYENEELKDNVSITKYQESFQLKKELIRRYEKSCENETYTIDVSDIDVSEMTNMELLFANFKELKEIKGLETWDTSQVKDMGAMFARCENLKQLDLRNFDTSKVKDMEYMFSWCSSLKEIVGLETWDTSNVEYMPGMFANCKNIEDLDVSSFDTSKVKDMEYMFSWCSSLKEVDVSSFDTSEVKNMYGMFYDNSKLEEIKGLENFDLKNVIYLENFFNGCENLNPKTLKELERFKEEDYDMDM